MKDAVHTGGGAGDGRRVRNVSLHGLHGGAAERSQAAKVASRADERAHDVPAGGEDTHETAAEKARSAGDERHHRGRY